MKRSQAAGVQAVRESMAKARLSLADFAHLISPAGGGIAGAPGPAFACDDAATVRQGHPPLRAALSFQRVHQQLPVLRFLARQSDPARDAVARRSETRGATRCGSRAFATSCSSRASIRSLFPAVTWRDCVAALHPGLAGHLARSRADGNGGLPAAGRGGRGRPGGLSGDLRPQRLRGHAHRRAETEFRLAAGNARTRLRGGLSAAGHRPRSTAWPTGGSRPSASRRTRTICCAIAGRRN